jgi:cystathionine beta-lyase
MSRSEGPSRRTFLKSAGLTALAGGAGAGAAPATAAAEVDAPGTRYDFDNVVSRIGSDCVKYDKQIQSFGREIQVGMGIADLDFKAPPAVTRALQARIQHENHGYLSMPKWHVDSIVNWNKRRYGVEIDPKSILHSPGLHPALISGLRAFSPPGSKVLVQSPTYNAFYTDIALVGCKAEDNPLKLADGRYRMDFEDLERRIDHDTHTLILCNPQNPTGNVWSRQDLLTLGEICTRRRVVVFADEIHCDFVNKGNRYTPYSSLGDEKIVRNSITFKSGSKSFNLAGLKCAYLHSSNPSHIARIKGAGGHREDVPTLGVVAHRAAYDECERWLDQLVEYIDASHEYVASFVAKNIPLVRCVKPQGTFLAWLDVSALAEKIGAQEKAAEATRKKEASAPAVTPELVVERYLVENAKVHVNGGSGYGTGGAGRVRMNIGTSRKLLELALGNIAAAAHKA